MHKVYISEFIKQVQSKSNHKVQNSKFNVKVIIKFNVQNSKFNVKVT